ncbi:MAG: helix-turn-helix transcriptional regulator [bacterium]|nr:helix-turn-helix transcriptional regulator [bacterium]
MDKKKIIREVGYKLQKLRESLRYRVFEMADYLGNERTSYTRYEQGQTAPKLMLLYKVAEKFDISLDWLIRNKGPMYFKQKQDNQSQSTPTAAPPLPADIKELLDHMDKIPLLRYEVLTMFHKFKEKNKDSVAEAMGSKGKDKGTGEV